MNPRDAPRFVFRDTKSKRLALGLASFALVESAALEEYAVSSSSRKGGQEGFSLLWGKSKGDANFWPAFSVLWNARRNRNLLSNVKWLGFFLHTKGRRCSLGSGHCRPFILSATLAQRSCTLVSALSPSHSIPVSAPGKNTMAEGGG